jgi:hypothetical protein
MYRFGSSTSTTTETNNSSTFTTTETINSSVLEAIGNNNIKRVKELVDINNVNNILNERLNWTALDYALSKKNPDREILEYLISITNEKINHLNITNHSLLTKIKNDKKDKKDNDKLKHEKIINDILVKENSDLKENNKKLKRKLDESDEAFDNLKHEKIRNDILVKENSDLKENNKKLKRKLDESDKAFDNLLKKSKK